MRKYYLGECTVKKAKWSNVIRKLSSKFTRRSQPCAAHCRQWGRQVQGPWGRKKNAWWLEREEDELEASGPLEPLPVRSQSLGLLVLAVRSHGQISSRVLT